MGERQTNTYAEIIYMFSQSRVTIQSKTKKRGEKKGKKKWSNENLSYVMLSPLQTPAAVSISQQL